MTSVLALPLIKIPVRHLSLNDRLTFLNHHFYQCPSFTFMHLADVFFFVQIDLHCIQDINFITLLSIGIEPWHCWPMLNCLHYWSVLILKTLVPCKCLQNNCCSTVWGLGVSKQKSKKSMSVYPRLWTNWLVLVFNTFVLSWSHCKRRWHFLPTLDHVSVCNSTARLLRRAGRC